MLICFLLLHFSCLFEPLKKKKTEKCKFLASDILHHKTKNHKHKATLKKIYQQVLVAETQGWMHIYILSY